LASALGVTANTVARWERGELRIGDPGSVVRALNKLERRGSDRVISRGPEPDDAMDRPRSNLPAELSSFIGRERQVERLADRITASRLVTLVGAGGVGKTRLATRVGARVLPRYPDGVWLVELATVLDSTSVPNAVAAVLGIRERGRISPTATLTESMRDRRALLVLDNCEHLLAGCAELVHDLLRDCRQLTILATSREPLRVVGEVRWPVPPLALSSSDDSEASEAAQLFVERARAVQPDFDPSAETRAVLADICVRLDGLPLAIELAAARTSGIPARSLLQQLESTAGGLGLLADGPRDAPARQQTLRATITWSYDLLTTEERALFRRLAPFRGCTLEGVSHVCVAASDGPRQTSVALTPLTLDARAGMASLVEKNLLRVEEDERGEPWYVMLETVREFALERLEASPEAPAVWRRHAWYYLRLVEQSDSAVRALRQDVFLNRLEREHANCRVALDWCQAHGYAEASLRLCVELFWFWGVRGHVVEGRSRLEALLARFPLRTMFGSRASAHAGALDALGAVASNSDLAAAQNYQERALAIYQALGHPTGICAALEGLGNIARLQGDLDAARGYFERALATLHTTQSDLTDPAMVWLTAAAHGHLGHVDHDQGDFAGARAQMGECGRLLERINDTLSLGVLRLDQAEIAADSGDYEGADALARSGLELLESGGDRRGVALALAHLGAIATARGDFGAARSYLSRSLRLNREIGEIFGIAFAFDRLAILASAAGQPETALRLTGAAAALRDQAGSPTIPAQQRQLDEQIAPARRALGRMAETALAAGRKLSMSEAITEAMAVADDVTADDPVLVNQALSRREMDVAKLVGRGCTNRQIANQLVVAEGTVATHVQHILAKLELTSRAQIAVWATQHGLLHGPARNPEDHDATLPR
jgi:non-specific serine/threonine protein kinase